MEIFPSHQMEYMKINGNEVAIVACHDDQWISLRICVAADGWRAYFTTYSNRIREL